MSRSEAELTLVIRAKNLATQALANVETALDKVRTKAGKIAGAFRTAFAGLGGVLSMAVSGLVYDLGHGSTAEAAFGQFGLTMGVLAAETFVLNMGSTIAAKVAGSAILQKIGVQLALLGAAMGGIVDTAMGIAMAALPFVLIAALVAAIAVLIFNEEIRNKVFQFVGEVISNIGKFLGDVGATLLEKIGAGIDWVATNIGPFVGGLITAIIDGLVSLPGKIAQVIFDAFNNLKIDIGPFHIRSTGVTIDLPDLNAPPGASYSPHGQMSSKGGKHSQAGGWRGLNGPELTWLGEHNPEYVHPEHGGSGPGGGVTLVGVSEADLTDIIERRLFVRLQRSAATAGRT